MEELDILYSLVKRILTDVYNDMMNKNETVKKFEAFFI